MLAFYMHQILEMTDALFAKCRALARTFKQLWAALNFLFNWDLFYSWEHMLRCYIAKRQDEPPPDPM